MFFLHGRGLLTTKYIKDWLSLIQIILVSFIFREIENRQKKSRIRETKNLSTDKDSRTNTILERLHDLGAVHKLYQPDIGGGGSRPPLPPLSAIVSISSSPPPPFVSHCQHFLNPPSPLHQLCQHFPKPPSFFRVSFLNIFDDHRILKFFCCC